MIRPADDKHLEYPESVISIEFTEKAGDHPVIEFIFARDGEDSADSTPVLIAYPWFRASAGELLTTSKRWYAGLGGRDDLDADAYGSTILKVMPQAMKSLEAVVLELPSDLGRIFPGEQLANLTFTGLAMAEFDAGLLKTKDRKKPRLRQIFLKTAAKPAQKLREFQKKYTSLAWHMNAVRQVQSLPGNYFTASDMEKRARDLAARYSLNLTILGQKELEEIGAGGILCVNQGSVQEPRLIALEYVPENADAKRFAIIGKGVTFDTGGISIKPANDMHEMKFDMSGSAVAIHSVAAIAEQKLPVRVMAVVGMVENMPSGTAFKPGDVYTSLKGITIEVQNTDAEGRLVLGDCLTWAERNFKPDFMVDLATLTGAIIVSLANFYAGLFSPHEEVQKLIETAARESLEPVWNMPMGKRFRSMLKSDIADYNNVGGRSGGSCSAATFLSFFVEKSTRWAHLDIAGVASAKKGFGVYPAQASGYGVRLMSQIALQLASGDQK